MSDVLLEKLLEQTLTIVNTNLREHLNLQKQIAQFNPNILKEAIVDQLNFTYINGKQKYSAWYELKPEVQTAIIKDIEVKSAAAIKNLHDKYKSVKSRTVRINVSPINNNSFTVTTYAKRSAKSSMSGALNQVNPFTVISTQFSEIMESIWKEITSQISATEAQKAIFDKKEEKFNLGHDKENNSVASRQVKKSASSLYTQLVKKSTPAIAQKILDALELKLVADYTATGAKTSLGLRIESASKNKSEGTTLQKQVLDDARTELAKSLKIYLSNPKRIIEIAGSDNRLDIERKKIVKSFVDGVTKSKVKSIDTRLKLSKKKKTKNAKLKFNITTTRVKTLDISKKVKAKNITNKTKATQPVLNLNALKAQINARLSMTVIKNMGTPALQNRSGRFARSTQVTDVIQTSQGFPSIGYTYQKFPYQTFEPGFKQGSVQRDPRTLIDRSIREIAQQLIVGRFYTRRA